MNKCLNDEIFGLLSQVITAENIEAYVIGGWVRDCLLKRNHPDKDIDIVVIGNGIEIARKVAKSIDKKIRVCTFRNFGTAMFRFDDYEVEFVGARKEHSIDPFYTGGGSASDGNGRFTKRNFRAGIQRCTWCREISCSSKKTCNSKYLSEKSKQKITT